MRRLLDRHLGDGWWHRASDPATWEGVADIPDEELWAARNAQRESLVEYVRRRSTRDRLNRGDPLAYVTAAEQTFSTDYLIVGSARRVAMYKRLYLLVLDPARAIGLVSGSRPAQTVLAGKAHPLDDDAKQLIKNLFGLRAASEVAQRVAFLEDYDMAMASRLVAGADVWLNTPLPPLEASGTSGMKAAFNGGLHLSILDGWWEEGFNGDNGWGVRSSDAVDPEARDAADAAEFYRLIESQVVPLFYHRGEDGIPHGWIAKIKSSLRSLGPQFCASRMLDDYCSAVYPARV
jgi:starch phosphorylase